MVIKLVDGSRSIVMLDRCGTRERKRRLVCLLYADLGAHPQTPTSIKFELNNTQHSTHSTHLLYFESMVWRIYTPSSYVIYLFYSFYTST